jgi:CBS domain-containing protein
MEFPAERLIALLPVPIHSSIDAKIGDRNMGTKVSSVLKHKGRDVVTVAPQQTVAWVVKVLAQNRIGAVPVISEEGQLIGIISERDIIRGMSEHADAVLALAVDQLMTRGVKTCSPEDQLVDLMEVMTLQRIRHLPVIQNGALHGIVSIGDVVKQRLEEVQSEAEELRRYIRSP